MPKSPPRVNRFQELTFSERFEYGDQASAVQICGPDDMSELGAGFGRLKNARFPWTIKYDEIIIVLDGELTIHTGGKELVARKHDSIWLPAGTELEYAAKDALIAYAIHPANWASD